MDILEKVMQDKLILRCKIKDCFEPVDTEPDKSKPSCNWFRFSDKVSEVAMYPSKKCAHGLCAEHAREQWFKVNRPPKERG